MGASWIVITLVHLTTGAVGLFTTYYLFQVRVSTLPLYLSPLSRVQYFLKGQFDPVRASKVSAILSRNEKALLIRYWANSTTYFEFGSGGSTAQAAIYVRTVYSVESDAAWHAALREKIGPADHIVWMTIDLKVPWGALGAPGPRSPPSDWPNYTHAYRAEYGADMILIDGRFRVACALAVFSEVTRKTFVLMHDFRPRPQYWVILYWYDLYEIADSLAVLVKKEGVAPPPAYLFSWYDTKPHDQKIPNITIPAWPTPLKGIG
jgi:hypothetical protein